MKTRYSSSRSALDLCEQAADAEQVQALADLLHSMFPDIVRNRLKSCLRGTTGCSPYLLPFRTPDRRAPSAFCPAICPDPWSGWSP